MRGCHLLFMILPVALFFRCQSPDSDNSYQTLTPSGWQMAYKHDENGKRIEGNIDSLIQGIRNGYEVRIGWGWQRERGDSLLRLEHMAQPIFLSVIQEGNVSAVIDAHPLLDSYIAIEQQKFRSGGHIWQCVLTTQGTFNAQVYHRSTGELLNDWPQKHHMTWFLQYPPSSKMNRGPLFE